MPTETVYGLAASIFDPIAIQKIFLLKGRPQDNPLIAHVSTMAMVDSIAEEIPPIFYQLAEAFWPGPITFILARKACVPSVVSAGLSTVAIRMPSHPKALQMIDSLGCPLVAPSANISGRPSPTCVTHVLEDFQGKIGAILDGGPCEIGLESTVLNLVSKTPLLLRPGAITSEQISAVLGQNVAFAAKNSPIYSPGMKYRHYAPQGTVRLATSIPAAVLNQPTSFILSRDPLHTTYRRLDSSTLYSHLREADLLGVSEIWVLLDPVSRSNQALMNRLTKAAEITSP